MDACGCFYECWCKFAFETPAFILGTSGLMFQAQKGIQDTQHPQRYTHEKDFCPWHSLPATSVFFFFHIIFPSSNCNAMPRSSANKVGTKHLTRPSQRKVSKNF